MQNKTYLGRKRRFHNFPLVTKKVRMLVVGSRVRALLIGLKFNNHPLFIPLYYAKFITLAIFFTRIMVKPGYVCCF